MIARESVAACEIGDSISITMLMAEGHDQQVFAAGVPEKNHASFFPEDQPARIFRFGEIRDKFGSDFGWIREL